MDIHQHLRRPSFSFFLDSAVVIVDDQMLCTPTSSTSPSSSSRLYLSRVCRVEETKREGERKQSDWIQFVNNNRTMVTFGKKKEKREEKFEAKRVTRRWHWSSKKKRASVEWFIDRCWFHGAAKYRSRNFNLLHVVHSARSTRVRFSLHRLSRLVQIATGHHVVDGDRRSFSSDLLCRYVRPSLQSDAEQIQKAKSKNCRSGECQRK